MTSRRSCVVILELKNEIICGDFKKEKMDTGDGIKQFTIRRGRSNHDVIVESLVGVTAGIFIGSIFKSVGRIAISTVGGGFVTISTLAQLGYIKIDWRKAEADYNRLKSRSSTIDLRSLRKIDLFKENLPFVGGLGGGFLLALGK